jgi:hypothetical protein
MPSKPKGLAPFELVGCYMDRSQFLMPKDVYKSQGTGGGVMVNNTVRIQE